jgi:predicted DNA-binding transcriptional regulator AlpA
MSIERRFLRLPEVLKIMGISRSKWYDGIKEGRFPAQIKLGSKTSVWAATDINALFDRLTGTSGGSNEGAASS